MGGGCMKTAIGLILLTLGLGPLGCEYQKGPQEAAAEAPPTDVTTPEGEADPVLRAKMDELNKTFEDLRNSQAQEAHAAKAAAEVRAKAVLDVAKAEADAMVAAAREIKEGSEAEARARVAAAEAEAKAKMAAAEVEAKAILAAAEARAAADRAAADRIGAATEEAADVGAAATRYVADKPQKDCESQTGRKWVGNDCICDPDNGYLEFRMPGDPPGSGKCLKSNKVQNLDLFLKVGNAGHASTESILWLDICPAKEKFNPPPTSHKSKNNKQFWDGFTDAGPPEEKPEVVSVASALAGLLIEAETGKTYYNTFTQCSRFELDTPDTHQLKHLDGKTVHFKIDAPPEMTIDQMKFFRLTLSRRKHGDNDLLIDGIKIRVKAVGLPDAGDFYVNEEVDSWIASGGGRHPANYYLEFEFKDASANVTTAQNPDETNR